MKNQISYEIKRGFKIEDLKRIIEYFNADCVWDYNFYCSKMTYPLYNPVYSHRIVLRFTFPFEIDKGFATEFCDLLLSLDIWEGVNE